MNKKLQYNVQIKTPKMGNYINVSKVYAQWTKTIIKILYIM